MPPEFSKPKPRIWRFLGPAAVGIVIALWIVAIRYHDARQTPVPLLPAPDVQPRAEGNDRG